VDTHIRLEVSGPVAELVLARPLKRNAVTLDMLAAMTRAVQEVAGRDDIAALVIRGEGPDFCAGEDVRGLRFHTVDEARAYLDTPLDLMRALEVLPKPVVVAVHGHALGFGAEVLLMADGVFVSEDAVIGCAEIDHGLVPPILVTRGLGTIRRRHAVALALLGERLHADEAVRVGLAHAVVPDPREAAMAAAREWARWSPHGMAALKGWLALGIDADLDRARDFMPEIMVRAGVNP
jgi:enoyl-CoA hydratase/carnithine racemase